jgi:hypothetical protein
MNGLMAQSSHVGVLLLLHVLVYIFISRTSM